MDGDDPPLHALAGRRQDALDGREGDRPLDAMDAMDARRSPALADPSGGSGADDHRRVVRGVLRRHLHADLAAAAPPDGRCVHHLAAGLPLSVAHLIVVHLIVVLLAAVLPIVAHLIVGSWPSGVLPALDAQVAWAWPLADIVVRS
ncbi:hypothetical protein BH10ACT2_BH10ACT2_25970 [soil metagenome]